MRTVMPVHSEHPGVEDFEGVGPCPRWCAAPVRAARERQPDRRAGPRPERPLRGVAAVGLPRRPRHGGGLRAPQHRQRQRPAVAQARLEETDAPTLPDRVGEMSPGLGIVHHGSARAFVLDIADLYKSEITVPLAFKQLNSGNPGRDVMRALRDEFRLLRLLPRIVDDIYRVLEIDLPDEDATDWDVDFLTLWGSNGSVVAAGHNRHGRDEPMR